MPTDYHTLRAKYPRWAHRRDDHRRRRRKRKRARRSRRKKKQSREKMGSTTEGMLMSLLHQLMLGGTLAKKHGENVVTGYADRVRPDACEAAPRCGGCEPVPSRALAPEQERPLSLVAAAEAEAAVEAEAVPRALLPRALLPRV